MAVLAKKKKISYIGVLCYDNQQESRAISKESRTISGKTRFHARTNMWLSQESHEEMDYG